MNKRIYLSSPHMGGEEQKYIAEAFDTNWIAPLGPNVDAFERDLAEYVGVKYAAALSSGTAAIHLALRSLDVGLGDSVFCSSFTFSASANPIIYQHALPVFIDSEPNSWNMCPKALANAFKRHRPKAVIVVNLYGQSANIDEIREVCSLYATPIIEDAAESLGATYKSKKSGSIGNIGIFSFNSNKIITTSGGGMLVCDDENVVKKVRFWSTQSRENVLWYEHKELGFNYRMSNICAGIGRGQLKVLDERVAKKREIFQKYAAFFADIPEIDMAPIADYGTPNCWLSCITFNNGQDPFDVIEALAEENIESRPIWKPLHTQPYFRRCDYFTADGKTSVSDDIFARGMCLPSDTKMTDDEIATVASIVRKVLGYNEL